MYGCIFVAPVTCSFFSFWLNKRFNDISRYLNLFALFTKSDAMIKLDKIKRANMQQKSFLQLFLKNVDIIFRLCQ